jgi:hypothetical protein
VAHCAAVQRSPPPICSHLLAAAGGQLFLFDRRACRFFRRDGHTWCKKKDGKTIKETHEKLKGEAGRQAGSARNEAYGVPAAPAPRCLGCCPTDRLLACMLVINYEMLADFAYLQHATTCAPPDSWRCPERPLSLPACLPQSAQWRLSTATTLMPTERTACSAAATGSWTPRRST